MFEKKIKIQAKLIAFLSVLFDIFWKQVVTSLTLKN